MIRILIVDDSAFLRRVLKSYFSKTHVNNCLADGCQLLEADSKENALRVLHQEPIDLVLLDIVMDAGDRDGIEALTAVMRMSTPPKVLMMSAIGQNRIIQECMEIGASGYVLKPFDEEQVLAAVETALSGQHIS